MQFGEMYGDSDDKCFCIEPRIPDMVSPKQRKKAFEAWKWGNAEQLVKAGFFAAGNGIAMCYSCGIMLDEWKGHEVPMAVHAFYAPDCPHVMTCRGQNWIESVHYGAINFFADPVEDRVDATAVEDSVVTDDFNIADAAPPAMVADTAQSAVVADVAQPVMVADVVQPAVVVELQQEARPQCESTPHPSTNLILKSREDRCSSINEPSSMNQEAFETLLSPMATELPPIEVFEICEAMPSIFEDMLQSLGLESPSSTRTEPQVSETDEPQVKRKKREDDGDEHPSTSDLPPVSAVEAVLPPGVLEDIIQLIESDPDVQASIQSMPLNETAIQDAIAASAVPSKDPPRKAEVISEKVIDFKLTPNGLIKDLDSRNFYQQQPCVVAGVNPVEFTTTCFCRKFTDVIIEFVTSESDTDYNGYVLTVLPNIC